MKVYLCNPILQIRNLHNKKKYFTFVNSNSFYIIAYMEQQKKERIKRIMEEFGLNKTEFSERTGIGKSTLSLMFTDENRKVSQKSIELILTAFSNISSDWLMFGKEPMYKNGALDLFGQTVALNTVNSAIKSENHEVKLEESKETSVNRSNNLNEQVVAQSVIHHNLISRKIDKIVIFYSDNTFENFFPEKPSK
jgi:transcriptional regulator with XRE-family HTH domain